MHAGKYWLSSDLKGINDEGNENFSENKQHQIPKFPNEDYHKDKRTEMTSQEFLSNLYIDI